MAKEEQKCKGGMFCMLLSIVVWAIGLYFLVMGIKLQVGIAATFDWMILLYYLIAALLMGGSKMHMHKAHMSCNSK